MFPLGTVLFPSAVLPLHLFEDRYRQLARDCIAGDGEFGVVMIERGSEVGGGDVRSVIGTVARIVESEEFDDGRWGLITVGDRRIRIEHWLDDDPYPRAEVSDWPDADPLEPTASVYRTVVADLRRALGIAAELGGSAAPATIELSEDPALGSFQIAAVSPFGPLDRQALLGAESVEQRLDLAGELLREEIGFLESRLSLLSETAAMENDPRGDPGSPSAGQPSGRGDAPDPNEPADPQADPDKVEGQTDRTEADGDQPG